MRTDAGEGISAWLLKKGTILVHLHVSLEFICVNSAYNTIKYMIFFAKSGIL